MPCYSPLTAYFSRDVGASGKRGITFQRSLSLSGIPMKLPCGQCIGCKLEYSRQWAIRCLHEKRMYADNVFLTLTFDDEHLPANRSLAKRDLQLFMKRLRKLKGAGVRFFACGEYGEQTKRPHYHLILFNCEFPDKKFYKRTNRGETLYTSAVVADLWPYGYNVLGEVTFDSCAYVARYVCDKITGPVAAEYYQWVDADGEVHSVLPEFVNMSRRPGIGTGWFEKYGRHAYQHDSVIVNGHEVRPPRFYDTRYELVDAKHLSRLKSKRRLAAAKHSYDNSTDRRRVREAFELKRMSTSKRNVT